MNTPATARLATRLNTSVLAGIEKRLLIRIAERLPAAINSDHLTVSAALAMAGIGLCFWMAPTSRFALACVIPLLVVNWFGDSLDGTVARVRRVERPCYGYYVDHVLDAIGFAAVMIGLVLGHYMSLAIGLGFTCAYYLLVIEVALAAHAGQGFRMSFWHLGPTELRIVLAAGVVQLWRSPEVTLLGSRWLLFDVGGLCGILGLCLTFATSAIATTRALYRDEPLAGRRVI